MHAQANQNRILEVAWFKSLEGANELTAQRRWLHSKYLLEEGKACEDIIMISESTCKSVCTVDLQHVNCFM